MTAALAFAVDVYGQAVTPSLSESDRYALAEVVDGTTTLDQGPGFFALAALAVEHGRSGSSPMPAIPAFGESPLRAPPWAELHADPQAARGQTFRIEGELLRSQPHRAARPGAWGDLLVECLVQVGEGPGDLVLVYLTRPASNGWAGAPGDAFVSEARFYKLWRSENVDASDGRAVDYPVFVSGVAVATTPVKPPGAGGSRTAQVGLALVVAFFGVVLARRAVRRATGARNQRPSLRERVNRRRRSVSATGEASQVNDVDAPTSASDPAEALGELRGRA
ncbi:MAG: hypothetical protein AAF288_01005 [Planctomycetota bacterium]